VTDEKFKIFTGHANQPLAASICKYLDVQLGQCNLGKFSDGEIYFQILETFAARTSSSCSPAAIRWIFT